MRPVHLLFLLDLLCLPLEMRAAVGFPQPRGIYVLDGANGHSTNGVSMRDGNIRSNDFVSGYVLRASWATMETNQDQFDFTLVDWNIRRLAAINKNLSLEIINVDPPWLAQTPGVTTWYDTNSVQLRAVPWDGFLLARAEIFLHALAEYQIDGVKLKDHPVLTVVNFGLAGADLAIRDPSVLLRNMSNYSRAALTNAVLLNLRAAVTNFPAKFVQIGFWPITDNQATPSLWEFVRESILAEFNGVTGPRVGFWMENLSASRAAPGVDPLTGRPNTTFGGPLFLSQTNAWVGFQALTSWAKPFNNYNSQVTNATPADGMQYASDTFGSTYFEIYVGDIDAAGYQADFEQWRARLFPPNQISIGRADAGAIRLQWPSWPGGVYQVEASTDLRSWTNSGAAQLAATNVTAWTNGANQPAQFYRLRTLP
ncbi:MAG: hypothetical protein NTZ16_01375 [Verrucomicrobia bacterium]|nr:hypothetical protein [Verrucomicrobiota bacterium]